MQSSPWTRGQPALSNADEVAVGEVDRGNQSSRSSLGRLSYHWMRHVLEGDGKERIDLLEGDDVTHVSDEAHGV